MMKANANVFGKFIRLGFLVLIDRHSLLKLKIKSILKKFEMSLIKTITKCSNLQI